MKITCGPIDDQRQLVIELPTTKKTIGIFISGGLDSAILYFLLVYENIKQGNLHEIIPFTVLRKEGSQYFARHVVEYVQRFHNLSLKPPLKVGDNTLPEYMQISSGISDAIKCGCDQVYAGVIEQLSDHMSTQAPLEIFECEVFKAPFLHLTKSHIVDLVTQHRQQCIFYITHSCDRALGKCLSCNGCKERTWGFEQMRIVDPGEC